MIHEIKARRLLFAPLGFLNSVARWILGVRSSDGSLLVRNTANPGRDGSIDLRVNFEAVYANVVRRLEVRDMTKEEVARVKGLVRGFVDGVTLSFSGGHVGVDAKWFEDAVKKYIEETMSGADDDGSVKTLASGFGGVLPLDEFAKKATDEIEFGKSASVGGKVFVACRGTDGGEDGVIFFREFSISKNGTLRAIGPETQAMGVYTNQ